MNVVTICSKCDLEETSSSRRGREIALKQALDNAGLSEKFSVRWSDCLNVCDEAVTLAIQSDTKATYVFAGVSLNSDIDDIVSTCRAYLAADGGWIDDARPCGRLRHCLKCRIPAL